MVDHLKKDHGLRKPTEEDVRGCFYADVTRSDKDPLRRVLRESLLIRDAMEGAQRKLKVTVRHEGQDVEEDGDFEVSLLNSKAEYFKPNIISGLSNVRDQL